MKWIYLSPHLDDVVFSCGGLAWEQAQAGDEVHIWTICAGHPPGDDLSSYAEMLHESWGVKDDIVAHRREEDRRACSILGAVPRHFEIPDCIYRRAPQREGWLYTSEESIFGGLEAVEKSLVEMLALQLSERLSNEDRVISPLGIGNHVDHELTRKAVHRLRQEVSFYADYPYVREEENRPVLQILEASDDWMREDLPISPAGLAAWQEASTCYRSQIDIFWEDERDLRKEIEEYSSSMAGVKLWRPV